MDGRIRGGFWYLGGLWIREVIYNKRRSFYLIVVIKFNDLD